MSEKGPESDIRLRRANCRRKPSLAIRIFLNMSGSSASEANAVFRTKALIGLGSVAALYQITEGMPGRVTD